MSSENGQNGLLGTERAPVHRSGGVVSEQHLGAYWLMTSPVSSHAQVIRFNMWTHHESKLAKVIWSAWLAANTENGDPGEAIRNPQAQIFHVRSGQFIPDEGTFPHLGFQEGDVFVLLPDGSTPLREFLEAIHNQLPDSFPIDLPVSDEAQPLRKVLQMVDKRQHKSGIQINAGRDVNLSGVLAESIDHSRISIGQSGDGDDLKKAVLELTEAVARLAVTGELTEREQGTLSADIDDLVQESEKPPAERRQVVVSRALDHLLTFGERAASVGIPIVDLIAKLQDAFGG